ncbi:hypothetical protein FB390_6730 [Nocardia bhagyanarayanae]|uniref:Uncharacterized protein n=1 Tax=Nocardia bhagyanarayanae TaxID=1215925 RepID=A0A543EY61_9NOCA|nr:hypothetical protein FB390_6730 [Nocardia bhagyanarayanae]
MADARFARTKRIMLWTDLGFLAQWAQSDAVRR